MASLQGDPKQSEFPQAIDTYTILTVGDGLVSQMPALLISTAAGIVVTRTGDRTQLGKQMSGQVFGNSQTLLSASVVMVAIGMIPGMPLFAFASLAGGTYYLSRRAQKAEKDQEALKKLGAAGQTAAADQGEKQNKKPSRPTQVDTLGQGWLWAPPPH